MNSIPFFPTLAAVISTAFVLGASPILAQSETENTPPAENSDIEQLAVGNYWTAKETTYARDGEVDTEEFSTVVVVKKEDLGGRTCFQMKQFYHDTPRFDKKRAESDQDNDHVYWEFLENGNLYYFDSASEAEDTPPADEKAKNTSAETGSETSPTAGLTAENPALYLKSPAEAGDLYQSFDTVGTVIATDRVVKTPAGEFVCHVYGFLTDAAETLPHRSYTVEYWCPGIGFVKLEEFEIEGENSRLTYSMEVLAYHLEDGRSGGNADKNDRRSKIENVH